MFKGSARRSAFLLGQVCSFGFAEAAHLPMHPPPLVGQGQG